VEKKIREMTNQHHEDKTPVANIIQQKEDKKVED
jgi:hypothetical protein